MNKIKTISCIGLMAVMLAGCGFRPMYARNNYTLLSSGKKVSDSFVVSEMAKIKINPIGERFGQELRNNLLDLMTPKGIPADPTYYLQATLIKEDITQQNMRRDITATNERVEYVVSYELLQDDKSLVKGESLAFVSYDILANPYSTTIAQKKVRSDAAKNIANDITLRIGAYFYSLQHNKAGK